MKYLCTHVITQEIKFSQIQHEVEIKKKEKTKKVSKIFSVTHNHEAVTWHGSCQDIKPDILQLINSWAVLLCGERTFEHFRKYTGTDKSGNIIF